LSLLGKLAFGNFFLFLKIAQRPVISGYTGPIFTIFSPDGRYFRIFIVDDRAGPLFLIPQGILQWQPIFGEICKMTFIRQADVPKRIEIWQFQF